MYVAIVYDHRIMRADVICVTEDKRTAKVVMENYIANEVSTEPGEMVLSVFCDGDKRGTYGRLKSALEISDELLSKDGTSIHGAIMFENRKPWLQFSVERLELTPKGATACTL